MKRIRALMGPRARRRYGMAPPKILRFEGVWMRTSFVMKRLKDQGYRMSPHEFMRVVGGHIPWPERMPEHDGVWSAKFLTNDEDRARDRESPSTPSPRPGNVRDD